MNATEIGLSKRKKERKTESEGGREEEKGGEGGRVDTGLCSWKVNSSCDMEQYDTQKEKDTNSSGVSWGKPLQREITLELLRYKVCCLARAVLMLVADGMHTLGVLPWV